jgi:hypothetical protein
MLSQMRNMRQIRTFRCPVSMHNHASNRAIGAGTAGLIVGLELPRKGTVDAVNKPFPRSADLRLCAAGQLDYLRTRRE